MGVLSSCRRRLNGKIGQVFKKVLFPVAVMVLMLKVLTTNDISQTTSPKTLVVPGEALDPFAPKISDAEAYRETPDKRSSKSDARSSGNKLKESTPGGSKVLDYKDTEGYLDEDLKRLPSSWSLYKSNVKDHEKVKAKGHAITNDTVTLTLMSSSDKVFMSLNKKEIYRGLEERGIHLVVINEHTGRVMAKVVFDTGNYGTELEMIEFIEDVSDGRIMVFAVRDDASTGLTWRGRNKLEELGSRWASKIAYRDMWALVTRQGGIKLAETYSNVATADTGFDWGGPVFLRTDFDLEEKQKNCNWPKTAKNIERAKFCARYEGYGKLCSCQTKQWEEVFFPLDDKVHHELRKHKLYQDMHIAVLCSNRPYYLFKLLKSLWEAPGLNKAKISVYCENPTREVINLVRLFEVALVGTQEYKNQTVGNKIRHKVQRIFHDIMGAEFSASTIPEGNLPSDGETGSANYLLILDDDIKLSIDIFKYLYSMADIFEMDKTVLGVTGFNYHGHKDVASSLTSFYRTSNVTTIALLLPKKTVTDVLAPNWPEVTVSKDWKFMFKREINKIADAAIIFPEVPRAKHFSYTGYTVAGGVQYNLFRDHVTSLSLEYTISKEDIHRATLPTYDEEMKKVIKSVEPSNIDFCTHDFIYGQDPKSMFIKGDKETIAHVMECLKTWPAFSINSWKGVWRLRYHGHPLYVISTPQSIYSNLMPSDYKLYSYTKPPPNATNTDTTTTASA